MTILYPEYMVLDISKKLLAYAEANYKDFMLTPAPGMERPAWFMLFMWLEPLFHIPIAVWAVRGLIKGASLLLL
jgi:hypothetical protein